MGCKGIGKLSLLSLADQIISETVRKGSLENALLIERKAVETAARKADDESVAGEYRPKQQSTEGIGFSHGTGITLKGLRKRQTIGTERALRTRLARRFAILGARHNFTVKVNDVEIKPEDRGYYNSLQYLWNYGDGLLVDHISLDRDPEIRKNIIRMSDGNGSHMSLDGWLGTVRTTRQLHGQDNGQSENLNRIAIFIRGKLAQEDILRDFSEHGVYASYLIGVSTAARPCTAPSPPRRRRGGWKSTMRPGSAYRASLECHFDRDRRKNG